MDRIARSRRRLAALGLVCALALLLLVSVVVPAFGGPHALTAASPTSLAKKALRLAKSADKNSKEALKQARRVSAKGGPAGPQGIQGAPGQQGPAGPAGSDAFGSLDYNVDPSPLEAWVQEDDSQDGARADCEPGQHAVGGGVWPSSADPSEQSVNSSYPGDRSDPGGAAGNTAWVGFVNNNSTDGDPGPDPDLSDPVVEAFQVYVVCAPAGNVAGPSSRISKARPLTRVGNPGRTLNLEE